MSKPKLKRSMFRSTQARDSFCSSAHSDVCTHATRWLDAACCHSPGRSKCCKPLPVWQCYCKNSSHKRTGHDTMPYADSCPCIGHIIWPWFMDVHFHGGVRETLYFKAVHKFGASDLPKSSHSLKQNNWTPQVFTNCRYCTDVLGASPAAHSFSLCICSKEKHTRFLNIFWSIAFQHPVGLFTSSDHPNMIGHGHNVCGLKAAWTNMV